MSGIITRLEGKQKHELFKYISNTHILFRSYSFGIETINTFLHVDIRRQMFLSLFEHGYSPYKNSTPAKDAYI